MKIIIIRRIRIIKMTTMMMMMVTMMMIRSAKFVAADPFPEINIHVAGT